MATWLVDVPVAGYMCIEVDADSKDDAIEKAIMAEWDENDIMELDKYEHIAEGNVLHVPINKPHAEKVE